MQACYNCRYNSFAPKNKTIIERNTIVTDKHVKMALFVNINKKFNYYMIFCISEYIALYHMYQELKDMDIFCFSRKLH